MTQASALKLLAEDADDLKVIAAALQEPEEVRVETGIRPDTLRPREELENFELDSLRMVGTVRQEGVVWALLNAKDGTIHRVRVGNYLGKNYGKIVNILDNQIELVEIFADSSGAWRERKAAVGMAVAPTDGADAEPLLRRADRAMYEVKRAVSPGRPRSASQNSPDPRSPR